MHFNLDHTPFRLDHGAPLKISGGRGEALRVLEGRVWVTEEGSLDDVFLDAGATYRLESSGSTIVTAEGGGEPVATVLFDVPLAVQARVDQGKRWFGWFGRRHVAA